MIKRLYLILTLAQLVLLCSVSDAVASKANLLKLGAVGDGVFDNSVILQHALNSCDTVLIPARFYCLITKTIHLNSENLLIGEDSLTSVIKINSDQFEWDNIYNPAAIVNSKTGYSVNFGSFERANRNIAITNLTFLLEGEKNKNMKSILRFSSVINLSINKCNFEVRSKNGVGHNAIIDLHSAYRNIIIDRCKFKVTTNNKQYGGCIWIQNASNLVCDNVSIRNSFFDTDCKDEMIAMYTTFNSAVKNVLIENNRFNELADKTTNISLVTVFNNVSNVKIKNNIFHMNKMNKSMDGIIRIGLYLKNKDQASPRSILIGNNSFFIEQTKCPVIKGYTGNMITVNDNKTYVKNQLTGQFIALPVTSGVNAWHLLNNKVLINNQ